jgi:hypothetical protein
VAEALYKAAETISRNIKTTEARCGIALPNNRFHRDMVKSIQFVLNKLEIMILWVDDQGKVTIFSQWEL